MIQWSDRGRPSRFRVLGFVVAGALACLPGGAASVPAWLDQAITKWNDANPAQQIRFIDIKDSFVWYKVAKSDEVGHAEVRSSVVEIAEKNGYKKTAQEELVTTGRPPAEVGPVKTKKCWSRSFTLDVEEGKQRLLTSHICEDTSNWLVGFRVLQ